jgi:hypothetical protein
LKTGMAEKDARLKKAEQAAVAAAVTGETP